MKLTEPEGSIYGVVTYGAFFQAIHVLTRQQAAKKLGKRLQQLRQARGLSQEDVSHDAGLGRSYYWRLEQGTINPTLETLVRLSNTLGVGIADLFESTPKKGHGR